MKKSIVLGLFGLLMFSCQKPDVEIQEETEDQGEYVNLINQQSTLKNQGDRRTCIVFSTVAAIEAKIKRKGFGEKNLSEEWLNFSRKAFYIHPIIEDYQDGREIENQLGSNGGGGGFATAEHMLSGIKIPNEEVMPYKPSNYYESNFPFLSSINSSSTQFEVNEFNLHPDILTDNILTGDHTWWSVTGVQKIPNPKNNIELVEDAVRNRNEVIIDFTVPQSLQVNDNGTWLACGDNNDEACGNGDTHSVLVVGFDKRDPDPDNHYFIIKNSWGNSATDNRPEYDGYTTFSYEFFRKQVLNGGYITNVKTVGFGEDALSWPEVSLIGRWKTNFDGEQGILDIYSLPGMNDAVIQNHYDQGRLDEVHEAYRIGTYYDENGDYYRVNGEINNGNELTMYLIPQQPILGWETPYAYIEEGTNLELYFSWGLKKYTLYLDSNNFMGGTYTIKAENDGTLAGGYATKNNRVPEGDHFEYQEVQSYFDTQWKFYSEQAMGTLQFASNPTVEYITNGVRVQGQFMDDAGNVGAAWIVIFNNSYKIEFKAQGSQLPNTMIGTQVSTGNSLIIGRGILDGEGKKVPFYLQQQYN